MTGTLEKLLERIRDGAASAEELVRARDLVAHDARLPEDLREIGLTDADDLAGDAVGLLAVLGAAPLFDDGLREALSDEAAAALSVDGSAGIDDDFDDAAWEAVARELREGLVAVADGFEIASAVMARLPAPAWAYGPVTAEAVRGEAGTVDVAGEAMAHLGDALPPVAEAVASEAGTVDVSGSVLMELSLEAGLPVADAVASEAGTVDVVGSVLTQLSLEVGLPVADAVASEAGTVDVVGSVLTQLSLETGLPVADAVASEAGTVDVVGSVLTELSLEAGLPVADAVASEAGGVEVAAEVLGTVGSTLPTALPAPPSVLQEAPPVPIPANRGWTWGAVVMAAVALLVVGLYQLPGGSTDSPLLDFEFAAAGELVVEDLDYADDVTVMQAEGDEGAVILWMEDV